MLKLILTSRFDEQTGEIPKFIGSFGLNSCKSYKVVIHFIKSIVKWNCHKNRYDNGQKIGNKLHIQYSVDFQYHWKNEYD